ncbi:MAG: hypothetical protein GY870_09490 [archaeon]|nr:hypothetical protein [archaeon]
MKDKDKHTCFHSFTYTSFSNALGSFEILRSCQKCELTEIKEISTLLDHNCFNQTELEYIFKIA